MEEILTISNDRLTISITNYGGRIMQWLVDGVDIVLGFDTVDEYKTANEPYHGALIGRYANRIANAQYSSDGVSYPLDQNHGKHILHGGKEAFHNTVWKVISKSSIHVELQNISPDGDQGFPGELTTIARYEIVAEDTLALSMTATSTKPTVLSLTHHPYFNLSGLTSYDLSEHLFQIHSNQILSTDVEGIPSGDIVDVGFTGFDFTRWKSLAKAMKESHSQINLLGGIDHTYITENQTDHLQLQAEAKSSNSKVHMQVYSNQPGLQFYTANHFDGKEKGKTGRSHMFRGAFCFEPQHWPDSPNQGQFPSTILKSNEKYVFNMKYKFLQ